MVSTCCSADGRHDELETSDVTPSAEHEEQLLKVRVTKLQLEQQTPQTKTTTTWDLTRGPG